LNGLGRAAEGDRVNAGGDEFLTVAEIARILKLNQQTVRNWIDQGTLPALRVGRRVRVRRSDFNALMELGRTAPAPASRPSPAQAFWEGELDPAPNFEPAEDE
jgi:excisionase family DNA binding protein